MALADWFRTFCSNLQIRDGGTIATRSGNITRRLNTDFWSTTSDTSHSLYVGSYGRNTAISGFSDVDLIFQLPDSVYKQYNGYSGNGQSALLQAVKTSIERTYSTTNIRADGQVIQVPFTDGINFEVVPAFDNNDGSFTFPNANDGGSWKTTNPRPEISTIRERNAATNGNLVPLCRMMRDWKDKWAVPIGGLLIDTLAYQFIETWEHRDKSYVYYDYMCRDFFKWMAAQDENQEWWRAPGSGQYVWGKGLFQYKAKRCYNLSLEAIEHEIATPKREWSAKQKWREIFTTNFPD
jgi:Second Messenger Oligonucleotide or Dinucleotide Synthetase domain